MKLSKRIVLLIMSCGIAAVLVYSYLALRQSVAAQLRIHRPIQDREPWMVIFMHGSFGTLLGFMNFFRVVQDDVDNTTYKKMISHMRYDPFFYQMQPILKPGLHRFTPTFDPNAVDDLENRYAIYPVSAAYDALQEYAHPGKEQRYFYTFGWSGLVSQQRRRKEAVRFYNMLQQEYARFRAQGISPKIRIITHSHGGNVALNMAGIADLLQKGLDVEPKATDYPEADQLTAILAIHKILGALPDKQQALERPHQKNWDFMPSKEPLVIDELYLLGTPIQPETAHFFASPFFRKVYHLYSAGDTIQSMDWVSTKRYFSEQRLPFTPLNTNPANTIIQAKITLQKHQPTDSTSESSGTEAAPAAKPPVEKTGMLRSLMDKLFDNAPPLSLDPQHKELWFMSWKEKQLATSAQRHIQPYPYVVLLPLIERLINKHPDLHDVDIRLKFKEGNIILVCHPHDSAAKRKKFYLPREELATLQESANRWQPTNISHAQEMRILHGYANSLTNG